MKSMKKLANRIGANALSFVAFVPWAFIMYCVCGLAEIEMTSILTSIPAFTLAVQLFALWLLILVD